MLYYMSVAIELESKISKGNCKFAFNEVLKRHQLTTA